MIVTLHGGSMGGHFEVYRLIEDQVQALRNKACKVRPLRDLAASTKGSGGEELCFLPIAVDSR